MLFQWGALQFDITPFNVHEADQMTATDWARKEIAGAAIYREWVGEGDEEITLRGRVFPHRLGGLTELEILESFRRQGKAEQMMRGDGIRARLVRVGEVGPRPSLSRRGRHRPADQFRGPLRPLPRP